jgi:methyl-accepting chemotaxis protein/methyl-accepting chemotaxis protein-1 (serine sensor receptor)
MYRKMSVTTRLRIGFLALSACALVLGGVSVLAIRGLRATLDSVTERDTRKVALAGSIQYSAADLLRLENGIIFRLMSQDQQGSQNYRRLSTETMGRLGSYFNELKPLLGADSSSGVVAGMVETAQAWSGFHAEMIQALDKQEYDAAQKTLADQITPAGERLVAQAGEYSKAVAAALVKSRDDARPREEASLWIATLVALISLVCAVAVHLVVRSTNITLGRVATDLSEGAEQVAGAASQVSSSSQSLAQGSSEQAASLEETSASSEEINSMSRKNAENSRGAAGLVAQSQKRFEETNRSLQQMIVAMSEIKASSDKISKIIKTIDEIAFQTNILALNAAVEAARAGEAGMGFAVVADEVRNLAQRCAQAAQDTAALIEESIAKSNDGKTKVDQVAVAIKAITEESAQVKTLVDEVNLGSQEQARGIEQIGKAIAQMEQVTQKTAANAEESASAAEELTAQSETLKDIVDRLTAMVGGDSASTGRTSPRRRQLETRRAAIDASRAHREPSAGLAAMRPAAVHKPSNGHNGHAAANVLAGLQAGKSALPLDDDFKEF